MGTSKVIRWFDVFVDLLVSFAFVISTGTSKLRAMIGNVETDPYLKVALGFTDEQLQMVFTLVGVAVLTGGLRDVPALEWAIKGVQQGKIIPVSHQYLRYLSTITAGSDQSEAVDIHIMPDMTLEQFGDVLAGVNDAFKQTMQNNSSAFLAEQANDFYRVRDRVIEGFEDYFKDAAMPEELALVDSKVINVPETPKTKIDMFSNPAVMVEFLRDKKQRNTRIN